MTLNACLWMVLGVSRRLLQLEFVHLYVSPGPARSLVSFIFSSDHAHVFLLIEESSVSLTLYSQHVCRGKHCDVLSCSTDILWMWCSTKKTFDLHSLITACHNLEIHGVWPWQQVSVVDPEFAKWVHSVKF